MLVGYDLEDMVHCKDCAGGQTDVVSDGESCMSDPLLLSSVQSQLQVAIPVDNTTDDVDIRLIQLGQIVWTVRRQVHKLALVDLAIIPDYVSLES